MNLIYEEPEPDDAFVLSATILLHNAILGDSAFMGYDGDKEQFDTLFQELSVIVKSLYQAKGGVTVGETLDAWYVYSGRN